MDKGTCINAGVMSANDFFKDLDSSLKEQLNRKNKKKQDLDNQRAKAGKDSWPIVKNYASRYNPRDKVIETEESKEINYGFSVTVYRNGKKYYKLSLGKDDFEIHGDGATQLIEDIMNMKAPPQPSIYRWDKVEFEKFLQHLIKSALVFE
jgi:hypothetical protein